MLFIPRLAAAYCWGFVLFFRFGRAWPSAEVGFHLFGDTFSLFTAKLLGSHQRIARAWAFAYFGQRTKLALSTKLPSTSA